MIVDRLFHPRGRDDQVGRQRTADDGIEASGELRPPRRCTVVNRLLRLGDRLRCEGLGGGGRRVMSLRDTTTGGQDAGTGRQVP